MHDQAPGFFTALSAAVAAIPGIGPAVAPLVATLGSAIATLTTTTGAAAVTGAAVVHHAHFGLPGTKRRAKLATARDAHRAAKPKKAP